MNMKTKFFSLFFLSAFIITFNTTYAAGEDWAQFNKYEADNNRIISGPDSLRPSVVFMGNSITEMWAKFHPEFFSENNFAGRGISGQTTYQMLLRFRDDVLNLKPDLVIINGGINDIAENNHSYNEDRTFGNIRSMAEMAKAAGIKVVLTSVLPANRIHWRPTIENVADKVKSLNDRLRDYAEANEFLFIDYYTPLADEKRGLKEEYARDAVHPNVEGYDIMESIVLSSLSAK